METRDYSFDILAQRFREMAYLNRGMALVKLGDNNSAVADLTKSIALGANIADAYESRSEAYSNLGKKDLAAKDKATAVKLSNK